MTGPARPARMSPWRRLVAACAALVGGAALALAVWGLASTRQRDVSYAVSGPAKGVMLDVRDADVEIVGGGSRRTIDVLQRERFSFGHEVRTRRSVAGGAFELRSRCPTTAIARSCSAHYRLVVPDNVPVTVRTGAGKVSFRDYRGSARVTTSSGDVAVESFCGFALQVRTNGGDVGVDTACAPERLALRTSSGTIHAVVPPGRYRIDADSASGSTVVRGVTDAPDAVYELQALSSSGDVRVETRG